MLETFYSVRKVFYIIIAFCGVPVNVVAIAILSQGKCGLSTCTCRYLLGMATADLLSVVTAVILRRISFYFPSTFLDIYPVCSVIFYLMCVSKDCSVWFTVTFSFDRFILICCERLKTKHCTGKTADLVLGITGALLCFKNVPFCFIFEPREIINHMAWYCDVKNGYYSEPGWLILSKLDRILTPLLPFLLISLFNILTVRHILVVSRVRRALRGQSKGENRGDPQLESRRRSIVLLFTISGCFILLWLTTVLDYLYYNIAGKNPNDYNDSEYIFGQLGYMLQNLSLCTNTFIYVVTQAKFRQAFVNAVQYPFSSLLRVIRT
ncbi:probable G-protein coupled receptor 139 [Narcine bancroftii]|uniref:probable G-protein coupled receptor 139 n=1 Tax=Narcine bancroftii TaxID=1343680 RepID=UPI003831E81B